MSRLALPLALVLSACTTTTPAAPDAPEPRDTPPRPDAPTRLTIGTAERPADVVLPTAHDGTTDLPLIVLLHGYGASAILQDGFLGVSAVTREAGIYLLLPDGTVDATGKRFWNATDACCNFGGSTVDDVAYLEGLLDQAEAMLPIDTTRVYFVGHSNGGFMSFRMACEASERIAAIAPLAGADYLDETTCVPTAPVSVLGWHGTLDDTVPYDGDPGRYLSAPENVERWATRAGCTTPGTAAGTIDVSDRVDGDETVVTGWTAGCTGGTSFTLWRIEGEGHIPNLTRDAMRRVVDWLLTHHR